MKQRELFHADDPRDVARVLAGAPGWKAFEASELALAIAFADEGGVAVHVCPPFLIPNFAPRVFTPRVFIQAKRAQKNFAHVFARDLRALEAVADELGMKRAWIQAAKGRGRYHRAHLDVVGEKLEAALRRCGVTAA